MFLSKAEWTKIAPTEDSHATEKQAQGVADLLMERYGPHTNGCEVRGHCTKSWIEPEKKDETINFSW